MRDNEKRQEINGETTKNPLVLIVETNNETASMIKHSLNMQKMDCLIAQNGNEALNLARMHALDVIIVNHNIPVISGMGLCVLLKTKTFSKEAAILFVSKRDNNLEQVKGLDKSFDDYLISPFPATELVSKVIELVKRKYPNFQPINFEYEDLTFDPRTSKILRSGKEVRLGPTEVRILQCFMVNPKKVFTRKEIVSQVWGFNRSVDPRTVDVHINRLRTALNNNLIVTIRSVGYAMEKNLKNVS